VSRRPPRNLAALFDELNRSHFAGRLGGYVVRRSPITPASIEPFISGPPEVHRLATTFPQSRQIVIAGVLNVRPVVERRVLLHEMCHVAAEDEALFRGEHHGPEWRSEMYRLAREHGEAWAADEAKRYES